MPAIPPPAPSPPGRFARALALGVAAAALVALRVGEPAARAKLAWAAVAAHGPAPWAIAGNPGMDPLGPGYPLDAALTWPLSLAGDAWMPMAMGAWLFAAGLGMAWLAGQWWGSGAAALIAGLGWQLVCADAVSAGEPAWLAALALLPVAWGLLVRALDDGRFVLAGLAAGALALLGDVGIRWAGLLAVPAVAAVVRERPRQGIAVAAGTLGVALVVGAGALGWRLGFPADEPAGLVQIPALLALVGAVGAWRTRTQSRRVVLPGLALLAGLGPVDALPVAGVGIVLLAGGLVA